MMNPKHSVVCFGEVLWDILPGGAVPGGAPMNVAFHLQQLKKNPVLITKVGNDDEGRKLKEIFTDRGVCTDFFSDRPHVIKPVKYLANLMIVMRWFTIL